MDQWAVTAAPAPPRAPVAPVPTPARTRAWFVVLVLVLGLGGAATGMRFESEGETAEVPQTHRPAYQPGRYGGDWAPVLISWAPLELIGVDDAAHTGLAAAAPSAVTVGGTPVIVSGEIVMSSDRTMGPGFIGFGARGSTLLHELGHLVGLGHVDSSLDVMTAQADATLSAGSFGPGDRAGLAALGREAGCVRVPPATTRTTVN
ncbi:MAG: hypothetical protein LC640_12915 [Frankia sp.]|nr:hypothetical protein [Frankia sp.]